MAPSLYSQACSGLQLSLNRTPPGFMVVPPDQAQTFTNRHARSSTARLPLLRAARPRRGGGLLPLLGVAIAAAALLVVAAVRLHLQLRLVEHQRNAVRLAVWRPARRVGAAAVNL